MSSTQAIDQPATKNTGVETVDFKLEAIPIPVSDVDRAKAFYANLGWTLDADFMIGNDFRAVQLTPPGSAASIHLVTTAVPGSAQGMFLVVSDIEGARRELAARGVVVTEVFHFDAGHQVVPGFDPKLESYGSYASFSDPDGNRWILQQVKTRLPGRGLSVDPATVTELLREAEIQHGEHGSSAPTHHWSEWYSGYIIARVRGRAVTEAAEEATRKLETGRAVAQA